MSWQVILVGGAGDRPYFWCLSGKSTYVVGRALSADIVVNHSSVSRLHANIHCSDSVATIEDLNSLNGTFVASERVSTVTLSDGQRIRFGTVSFILHLVNASEHGNPEEITERCDDPARSPVACPTQLTPAQLRVFGLLIQGLSEKEVAVRLGLSQNTIHHHVSAIYRVAGVTSRAELLAQVLTKSQRRRRVT